MERQSSFPRSRAQVYPHPAWILLLDCNGQYPEIWALMGLQDGLSERLLDRGARNLEVPVSVSCLLEDLGSWRREKLRREEADNSSFLLINTFLKWRHPAASGPSGKS